VITLTSPFVIEPGSPEPVSRVKRPTFAITDAETASTPEVLSCTWSAPSGLVISSGGCPAGGQFDTAGNGDGVYTLEVEARDGAGNLGEASFGYRLDTTAPPSPTLSPATTRGNTRTPSFALSNVEAGATLSCSIAGPSAGAVTACGPAAVVAALPTPAADGSYTVLVTATDQAGNTSAPATAGYQLDTAAPAPPIVTIASASPSSSRTPIWYWQYGRNDVSTSGDVATCVITGPAGWSASFLSCPGDLQDVASPVLSGRNGVYRFTVRLTDPAGNTASASATYVLDDTVPPGPTVLIISPRDGAGLSRQPQWEVTGPAGTTLSCRLMRGDRAGSVIATANPCGTFVSFSLAGMRDGLFTLVAVATDRAGNRSSPATSPYVLAPRAPAVQAPVSATSPVVWSVSGNPADSLQCTLSRGDTVVVGPENCGSHPSYDLADQPRGTYTLTAVQIGAEGVRSRPARADWYWPGAAGARQPGVSPTGPGDRGNPLAGPPAAARRSHRKVPASPLSGLVGAAQKIIRGGRHLPSIGASGVAPLPQAHPKEFGDGVAEGISNVATAIAGAGGGTGFPLFLVGLVIAFLVVQSRIDRRDPRLAFASAAADDMVDFAPPPSRKERP
jgi:hypothetical protein